ncbi:hypothetical protein QR680_008854 [Steinernema hermaphroditum]|uniref:C2H2-type domain-containing protein n=1 Tax=Steinernema hermaphroditum TaxID=289476 RepID=A0AA39M7T1_9BILA|nr:hypothetical protein QR680_008854 [Steinernema hermaphroditum]
MDVTSRLRQQAPLQLPTVCVSMESSGALPPRPIPVMGTPSPIASESTSPIPTGGLFNSDLSSLLHTSSTVMFSDAAFLPLGATSLPTLSTFEIEYFKFLADHPHLLRSETAGATSAMQVQSCDKWLSYREERTRSSSSDSGVTSQFSPPNLPSTSSVSISPPAFSPLHISGDSAFSTPSSFNTSRFVFPVQNPLSRNVSLGTDSVFGDAIPPSTSPDTKTLEESLLRIRTVSESFEQLDEFSDEIKQPIAKKPLERKTSVIHPTPTRPIPQKGNVFRSESLPVRFPTIVEAADPELNVNNVNMLLHLQTVQRLFNNNLFIPAVAASGILPVHSKSVSPLPPFDAPKPAVPLEEYSPDGKRQYICRVCNKDFKRPDILSRHLRRHTGEKPFHCEDCGRFFSRSDHLRTHQRTHTDEKPYKCDHCPYAARRRDVLTRHMSTRHQAKAGKSVFQRHRTVRRCVSDGDVSLATVQKEPQEGLTPVELIVARSSPFAKRERHTTEVATPTQPLIHAPRARHVTEIPSTSKDDFEENSTTDVDDDELEDDDFDDVGSVIDVTKIEDDVIVDMEPMCEDEQS